MRARYNIAKLRTIYGRTAPPDTPAILELRLWRRRADGLIQMGRVVDGLLLIEACSTLTLDYRKSRAAELTDGDRGRLHEIVAVSGVLNV